MGHLRPLFFHFRSFPTSFNRINCRLQIRTRIIGEESKQANHQTTTRPYFSPFFRDLNSFFVLVHFLQKNLKQGVELVSDDLIAIALTITLITLARLNACIPHDIDKYCCKFKVQVRSNVWFCKVNILVICIHDNSTHSIRHEHVVCCDTNHHSTTAAS